MRAQWRVLRSGTAVQPGPVHTCHAAQTHAMLCRTANGAAGCGLLQLQGPGWLFSIWRQVRTLAKRLDVAGCGATAQAGGRAAQALQVKDYFVSLQAVAHRAPNEQGLYGCGEGCSSPEQGSEQLAASGHVWLTEFKDAALAAKETVLVSHIEQTSSSSASFELSCRRAVLAVAWDVWPLEGHFSDNMVVCVPGLPRNYTFHGSRPFGLAEFKQQFRVTGINSPWSQ